MDKGLIKTNKALKNVKYLDEGKNLLYLTNLSNNEVSLSITSLFSAMSADKNEFSNDLIRHSLGLGVKRST